MPRTEAVPAIAYYFPTGDRHTVKAAREGIPTWPRAIGLAADLHHGADAFARPGEILIVTCEPEMTVVQHDPEED